MQPLSINVLILALVEGLLYISRSIEGAKKTVLLKDRNVANKILSEFPLTNFEMVDEVAGEIIK